MSEKYLYSVNPRKVINLESTGPIRVSKSLHLSKKDVEYCLKYGTVYRRFAKEKRNERVNITNLDRLHNEKFMTEEEYKLFLQSNIDNKRGTVINDEEIKDKAKEPENVETPGLTDTVNTDEAKTEEAVTGETDQNKNKQPNNQKYNNKYTKNKH